MWGKVGVGGGVVGAPLAGGRGGVTEGRARVGACACGARQFQAVLQLASLLAAAAHAPLPSQVSSRHVIEDAAVALEAAAITPPLSASGGVTNAAPRQRSRRRAATAASAAWAEVRPTKRPRSGGNY